MNDYKKITLKNGVTLYLFQDKNMNNIFVDYMIFYGSNGKWFDFNYDGKDYHVLPGVAHFLEHLLGEHSKYGNMYTNFAKRVYFKNGTTYPDVTHFFFSGKKEIKKSIKELIEAVDCPVFTEDDIKKTSAAIAEEARMAADRSDNKIYLAGRRNSYKNVDLFDESLCPIGTPETTYQIDYDTLKLCYDAFYYDENKALIVAGNVNEKEIVSYLESIYEKIPRHENKLKEKEYDLTGVKHEYEEIDVPSDTNMCNLTYKTKIPEGFSLGEVEMYHYIYRILNYAKSSKFQIENSNNKIVDSVNWMNIYILEDTMVFIFTCCTDKLEEYQKLHEKNLYNIPSREDFEATRRFLVGENARCYDDKIHQFLALAPNHYYTEHFSDLELVKSLKYDRFVEFINKLDYNEHAIVKTKNKKIR